MLNLSRELKALIFIFLIVVYTLVFLFLFDQVGIMGFVLSVVPIIFAAMAWGYLGGGISSVMIIIYNLFLLHHLTGSYHLKSLGLLNGFVFLVLIGAFVGWTVEKDKRIRDELRECEKVEKELKEIQQWYRNIFDGVNDAIFVETRDGAILDVNARACQLFGWTRDEFLTKTVKDMVPPEHAALLPGEGDGTPLPEEPFETVNMRANGETFPVSVSGRLQKLGDEERLLIVLRDITEQKRVAKELQDQHEFLFHVIESLTQPFYVINVKDYSIALSNSAASMDGSMGGRTCYALTHQSNKPCSEDEHPCPLQQVIETKMATQVEHIHYDKHGQEHIFDIHGYPVFDEEGQVIQMIEYALDVTEKRKADQELQKLSRAITQSPASVVITDLEGTIEYVNPAFTKVSGYTKEEAIGANPRVLKSGVHDETFYKELWATICAGETWQGKLCNLSKSGDLYWESASISPVFNIDGKITHFVAVKEDITEQKKAEEDLLKLSRAVAHSPTSVVITDAQAKINYVNPAYLKRGYSEEEVLGKQATFFYSDLHPKEFYKDIWAKVSAGEMWRGEIGSRNRDGEILWDAVSIAPIMDESGEIINFVGIMEDITANKKLLEETEKARKAAEAAAQAKANFLANMSHEIRTPLNAIYGMTSLMMDTPLNAEQQDFIETIRGGSDTLLSVINDILDFSKIEAGKMELEQQPFRLRDCVEETLDLLAEKAAEKMLDLAYIIEDGTPPVVVGDVTRVRQILVNLLNNAIKFTDEGEAVVHIKSLLLENDRHEIQFTVRDTGIGIPKDRLDKLFKSFSQVDSSTTRKYGGTGLGLAISKELAERMGGTMWVESEEGKGSTFHFTIVVDVQEAAPLYAEQDFQTLQGKRILIVDDNATNCLILIKQTESWGMKASAVESGDKALQLFEKGDVFDLAILDMQMPEMDGFTLAEKIREKHGEETPPILILTSIKRDKSRASDPKIEAFLSKPIKVSNLFNVLHTIVAKLPAVRRERKPALKVNNEMALKHPLRILLAEDNLINQKVALKLLEKLGYKADIAANGIEAVDAVKRQSYDLVFMDIQMPEMDGDEATRRIRETLPKEEQPYIVAMTAHALEGDREKYIARGMDDYISKPVQVKALTKAIQDLLNR